MSAPAIATNLPDWKVLGWVSMTDKRDAVALYVRLGLHPILLHGLLDDGACTCGRKDCDRSRGKHPVSNNWQSAPLDSRALDSALVLNWRYNVGLRTGMQPCGRGLVVVDVDGSRDLLRPVEAEAGEPLPRTLTARTGSGGLHLFYWLRAGVELRNRQGWAPHVDVRGYGGQVVAAPSVHLSGNKYQWIDIREPAVLP